MRFVDVFTLISYTYSHLNIFHFFSKNINIAQPCYTTLK
jgi:hypothetical protein